MRGLHRLSATRLSLRLLSIPFQIGSKSGRGVDAVQDLDRTHVVGVVLDAGVPGCTDRDRWLAAPNPSLPTEILGLIALASLLACDVQRRLLADSLGSAGQFGLLRLL